MWNILQDQPAAWQSTRDEQTLKHGNNYGRQTFCRLHVFYLLTNNMLAAHSCRYHNTTFISTAQQYRPTTTCITGYRSSQWTRPPIMTSSTVTHTTSAVDRPTSSTRHDKTMGNTTETHWGLMCAYTIWNEAERKQRKERRQNHEGSLIWTDC